MKQVLQNLSSGQTELCEVPCPKAKPGQVLIRTRQSLISAGTERMLVEFGKSSLLEKARQQPDKVRMVLDKVKSDGPIPTLEAVRNKLEEPLPLGYCNTGVVIAVGAGVSGFTAGDRVVSNGKHAEVVSVPVNLCAQIPDQVSDEEAAFTVIGAIALQGIRLLQPSLGETVVVTGLGLIGLLTVQLLRAHGCRVLGLDFDAQRLALARQLGAQTVDLSRSEDPLAAGEDFSRGRGVDAVIITASTKSSEPVHQAAQLCRKRGRIVLVGVTGLTLSRADFYEKELCFQVSCSYGPGRYDPCYEEEGQDYPVGFVRWTAQRNFEAVLDMLAERRIEVAPLISHRFPLRRVEEAYGLIAGNAPSLGILLEYPSERENPEGELRRPLIRLARSAPVSPLRTVAGFIGAGNHASRVLIPAFKSAGAHLKSVASNTGVSGLYAARKYGFEEATTDPEAMLADPEINAVVIATRHDSHARYVCEALRAGKHVFVEKPLALTLAELQAVEAASAEATLRGGQVLAVGFNRRFAPQVRRIKALLEAAREPKSFIMTVNAGAIPPSHWTQDPAAGGGRILGEGCHFIDLLRYLCGYPVVSVQVTKMGSGAAVTEDKVSFSLSFADGSFGTVHYLANGHKSFPKERLEVFCAGRVLQLDNFRKLIGYGWNGFRTMKLWRQDKGHAACVAAFVEAIRQGAHAPIPFEELAEVTRVSFDVVDGMT